MKQKQNEEYLRVSNGLNLRYGIPRFSAPIPSASSINRWYWARVIPTANFSISKYKSTFGTSNGGSSNSGFIFSFNLATDVIGPSTGNSMRKLWVLFSLKLAYLQTVSEILWSRFTGGNCVHEQLCIFVVGSTLEQRRVAIHVNGEAIQFGHFEHFAQSF